MASSSAGRCNPKVLWVNGQRKKRTTESGPREERKDSTHRGGLETDGAGDASSHERMVSWDAKDATLTNYWENACTTLDSLSVSVGITDKKEQRGGRRG